MESEKWQRLATRRSLHRTSIWIARSPHCGQSGARKFREKASAKDIKQRPQLEKAIDQLGKGDVLVLAEWDRATRSMLDGIAIVERVHVRDALIKSWTGAISI